MMFSILLLIFVPKSEAKTGSLLTGTYDPNSTALINERRDIQEIDVLRQIINQETLICLAVVKDVKAVVDDVSSVKRSMESTVTIVSSLQPALNTLKRQVDFLIRDNTLAQNVKSLKSHVDILLIQDKISAQKIENLERRVDTLSKDNALQQTVDTLKTRVNSLSRKQRRKNKKIVMICEKTIQETEQKFNRNIAEIYELLKNRTLQIVKKGSKITDCKDHYLQGQTQSGVYEIYPFHNESQVSVYCDMETEGGGWTAIQKRVSGSVSFNRTWAEYKNGFGTPNDSYWIGNDVIHQLTKRSNSSLYVSITLQNGRPLYEFYLQFSVSDEKDNYKLFLGGPATGTLGDSMLDTGYPNYSDLSGMSFSSPDKDNDRWSGNCAAFYGKGGGWWFNRCHGAFLNGPWSSAYWYRAWYPTIQRESMVTETMMLIRRH
ncbi:fibrinogen-like protein 1 [Saccostrea echinata]|uniref:fibrinogen-like protein 1 n=1 Tax=Saccostrea echinata TaxID=191078 RepID=UPI002A837662|nr:fibrinogen-like protein 1 [Saccostrea echinata]XP_061191046.1 fibrinogen-like protein 1 [Saccostrea echinata]